MRNSGSVTHWIREVKQGDERAAQQLWNRYFRLLIDIARRRLPSFACRAADEEDAVLSALDSFCDGAREGRFPDLFHRDDLWRLLVVITARKAMDAINHERRKKRGGGFVKGESAIFGGAGDKDCPGIEQVVGDSPSPEFAAMVVDEISSLLKRLGDDGLRNVTILKMTGYTNDEIALRLGCSTRTVERRLRIIRRACENERSEQIDI